MFKCRICGHAEGNKSHEAREMMFGLREKFMYVECVNCGCVQIETIPTNMATYYPPNYYSFLPANKLKILIKGPWLCDSMSVVDLIKRICSFVPGVQFSPKWMNHAQVKLDSRVLEVGSGNGLRLLAMKAAGYSKLTGVDPFVKEELTIAPGVRILKNELADINQTFDFIMLHHSLEHMPDQLQVLKQIHRILDPNGKVLIRIPLSSSYAWKTYGVNWISLDPPRHFFLHTPKSLALVAGDAGFKIVDTYFDSDFGQFVGSEQYKQDIPWRAPQSYSENKRASIFSGAQISGFKRLAKQMNDTALGDSAAFYLTKK